MRARRSMVVITPISNFFMGPAQNAGPFFMSGIRLVFIFIVSLLFGRAALAHDPGLSSAHIVRNDHTVDVRLAFAWADLASLTSSPAGSVRPGADQLRTLGPSLAKVAGGLVQVYSGQNLIESQDPVVSAGPTSSTEILISLHWSQVPGDSLRMEFPVLAGMPFGHRMMLTLGNAVEPVGLLDARHQTWKLDAPAAAGLVTEVAVSTPANVSWFSFILLGIEHILTGFDHLCFLLALLLVATRPRDVLTVITTFTVAHSITLAAAALGAVSLSSSVVEPLIAASIVYIGLENIILRRQPRYRLAVVFGFGLIHGLGFASGLAERLPGVTGLAVVPPLLGFNAGVEIGQLAVAACLVPLIKFARTRPSFTGRMQPACSLMIATAGFVWLLQRV